MKGDTSNSKLGLTMRQPFLGKPDWAKAEDKKAKADAKKAPAKKEEKKE